MSCKVNHCIGCALANTRAHQLDLNDQVAISSEKVSGWSYQHGRQKHLSRINFGMQSFFMLHVVM